ncbi:TPA: hypothetical protein ACGUTL_001103 [Vibrio vulnificus]
MEIKMAEIFGSEGMKNLHLRGALVLTGPEAEAAVLAVKNHDRLTQENAELREALHDLKRQVIVRAGERRILETYDIKWVSKLLEKGDEHLESVKESA